MDKQRKMYRYLAKSSQHVGEAGDTKPYMGALQVTRLTHVRAWVRRVFNTCVDCCYVRNRVDFTLIVLIDS